MIYITGDTHIPIDIKKLNTKNFPDQRELTDFFENIKSELTYKKWFCGHYHTDCTIDNHCIVYNDILNPDEV